VGGKGGGGGRGGEMTQALYAPMNNKKIKIKKKTFTNVVWVARISQQEGQCSCPDVKFLHCRGSFISEALSD
jgi:hypothetical protein